MDDSELRNDETILLTTQGIYVKSIPFEGVITNKRILLVDRVKNLLPPKEIPLATIKDVEAGENAIRDQIITLSIIAKTGETRQMVLTFSRQAGGNRIKERNEWVKILKDRARSSFEQVIRKVIPGLEPESASYEENPAPRIEVINSPVQSPSAGRVPVRKEIESVHPVKRIIETGRVAEPIPIQARGPEPEPELEEPSFGTFCSRCGNEVAQDAVFCNRCGSRIAAGVPSVKHAPEPMAPATRGIVEPVVTERAAASEDAPVSIRISPDPIRQALEDAQADEIEFSGPAGKSEDAKPSPVSVPAQPSPVKPKKAPAKSLIPRIFSPKDLAPTPLNPRSMPTAPEAPRRPGRSEKPGKPEKPRKRGSFLPGRKTLMAIGGVVLLIVLVAIGALVVYPMLTAGSGTGEPASPAPGTSPVSANPTLSSSGTPVVTRVAKPSTVPPSGVQVHISYLGSWKGTYGLPSYLQSTSDSGDKFYEVLNATGTIQATVAKLDSSTRHDLLVEIYKDGKLLTSGSTGAAFGSVALSVDVTTGVAQPAKTSGGTIQATTTTAVNGTANAANATVTAKPAGNTTPVGTTTKPTATVVRTATTAAK